jgi:hypothetical protein
LDGLKKVLLGLDHNMTARLRNAIAATAIRFWREMLPHLVDEKTLVPPKLGTDAARFLHISACFFVIRG